MVAALILSTAAQTRAAAIPDATPTAKPITCSIPTPCALATNSSSGAGYKGSSKSGIGLSGSSTTGTGVSGVSGSGTFLDPGVDGESSNNSTEGDAGGLFGGKALTPGKGPEYGLVSYGAVDGIFAETKDRGNSANPGYAISALDPVSSASSSGDFNVAVLGKSTVGTAVLGEANSTPGLSIFGAAPVGVYATAATFSGTGNPYAFAFFGETNSWGVDIHNVNNGAAVYLVTPSDIFEAEGTSGSAYIDYNGNETLSGTLTTSGGTYVRTSGSNGAAMLEYSGRATAPEVEDVGEAQLTNGRAYVPIDARLSETIDRRVAYYVFVTPEGDCNGLYVTQKSPAGFAVREFRGGRTSLAFQYRIVAKPVDEDGVRLATAPALPKHADDGFGKHSGLAQRLPALVSPEQRLRQRIGNQAYAEATQRFGER
jgi:hypothetical protein